MPAGFGQFEVSSGLEATPKQVWERVITSAGIDDELMPIARMKIPRGLEQLGLAEISLATPLGRSWILLFGIIPIDYDDITIVRLEAERGFLERSTMLSQRLWEHERTLEPQGLGCRLTDRVRFEPRIPSAASLLRPVFHGVFRHRHRRLRRYFGGAPA